MKGTRRSGAARLPRFQLVPDIGDDSAPARELRRAPRPAWTRAPDESSGRSTEGSVPFIPLFYDLEEIFSQIAHESRNYMSPLMGYASLINEHARPGDENHMASRMLNALDSMARYFDQLETYRIHGISQVHEVQWREFMESVVETFLDTNRDRAQVNVRNGVRGKVRIHAVLLKRTLHHLLRNAAESMKEVGAIELDVVLAQPTGVDENARIVITVSDEGCGISSAKINHIWKAFFTTKPNHFGLGLSYVSMAASILDMAIQVRSDENRGTAFSLTLKPKGGHFESSQAPRR